MQFEFNKQRNRATIYVTLHSTLKTPRQIWNYNFVCNWYILYANLLPHPTQNDRNINCTMSEDNNQQNGNSATNGDVPEIELIIKVKSNLYWNQFILSNSNTQIWNKNEQLEFFTTVLLQFTIFIGLIYTQSNILQRSIVHWLSKIYCFFSLLYPMSDRVFKKLHNNLPNLKKHARHMALFHEQFRAIWVRYAKKRYSVRKHDIPFLPLSLFLTRSQENLLFVF